jgi:hypothetical protein
MKTITLIVFTSALAVQFVAAADQTNPPALPKPIGRHVQANLSKWDLNHDGKLDRKEGEAYRRDQNKQRHDELERHIEALKANARAAGELQRLAEAARRSNSVVVPNALWREFDVNGNGVLEPDELDVYRQALAGLKARQQAAAAKAGGK